jgi:hypothetical protein
VTEPWILPLDSPGAPVEVAGGKGANLARLAGQGFPVPPGFLLTTDAYRAYVAHNRLEGEIRRALADLPSAELEIATASTPLRVPRGRRGGASLAEGARYLENMTSYLP